KTLQDRDAILMSNLLRIGPGIIYIHCSSVLNQFMIDIHYTGVAHIRTVFFEGNAQNQHPGIFDFLVFGNHELYQLFGHKRTHMVIYPTTGKDDLRMVTQSLSLMRQVIRIYAYAMSAYQSGLVLQKIP